MGADKISLCDILSVSSGDKGPNQSNNRPGNGGGYEVPVWKWWLADTSGKVLEETGK